MPRKPPVGSWSINILADRWDGRCPAKFFQLQQVTGYLAIAVELVIILASKVTIWLAGKDVINGDQHRMGNCNHCSFSASPYGSSCILRTEEAVFFSETCACAFNKGRFQRLIPVIDPPARSFTRAFIVAGAYAGP